MKRNPVRTKPKVVSVLGMPRSGTSAAARMLNLLGVSLGNDLAEPNAFNPSGVWEHRGIRAINEELLARLGGTWDREPELPAGWESASSLDDLRARARAIVRAESNAGLWAWKDPRTSLLLPFWRPLAKPACYVICVRNPSDVARSLDHAAGADMILPLWLRYVDRMLAGTTGAPRSVVWYEDVVADPLEQLRRLAELVGQPEKAEDEATQQAVLAFVDDDLWHYRTPLSVTTADLAIPSAVNAVYVALRIAKGPEDVDAVQALARRACSDQAPFDQLRADAEAAREAAAESAARLRDIEAAAESPQPALAAEAEEPTVTGNGEANEQTAALTREEYRRLVQRVRDAAAKVVPPGQAVAVVSRGDSDLLHLEKRRASHFPQTDSGMYAGHHPADGVAAIRELERVIRKGVQYLVFPATALWWLDHYSEFKNHLETVHERVGDDGESCVIFRLRRPDPGARRSSAGRNDGLVDQLREVVVGLLPRGATVVVVSDGDDPLLGLDDVWAFPFSEGSARKLPADSAAAIAQLEAARGEGGEFLVIPTSSAWWLDRYRGFARYLDDRYRLVVRQRHVCSIYELSARHSEEVFRGPSLLDSGRLRAG